MTDSVNVTIFPLQTKGMIVDELRGKPPDDLSARRQLLALPIGGVYARAAVIPSDNLDTTMILSEVRVLSSTVSSAVARARLDHPERQYRLHSTRAFTASLDVIVTVAVVRES